MGRADGRDGRGVVGRAARHLNGKAILYADTVTDSMRRAMEAMLTGDSMSGTEAVAAGFANTNVATSVAADAIASSLAPFVGQEPIPGGTPMRSRSREALRLRLVTTRIAGCFSSWASSASPTRRRLGEKEGAPDA